MFPTTVRIISDGNLLTLQQVNPRTKMATYKYTDCSFTHKGIVKQGAKFGKLLELTTDRLDEMLRKGQCEVVKTD